MDHQKRRFSFLLISLLTIHSSYALRCSKLEGSPNFLDESKVEETIVDTLDENKNPVKCDYCYSKWNLMANEYYQGCGQSKISDKSIDVEFGQCKQINEGDIHGMSPKPKSDQSAILCTCNDGSYCNTKKIKHLGWTIPSKFGSAVGSDKNKCCQLLNGKLEADAYACSVKKECEKCGFVYDPKGQKFYQDCLNKLPNAITVEKALFTDVGGDTDHCVWLPKQDEKKVLTNSFFTDLVIKPSVLQNSLVLCTCTGDLCNKNVALSKGNLHFEESQPTLPPPTEPPNTPPTAPSTTPPKIKPTNHNVKPTPEKTTNKPNVKPGLTPKPTSSSENKIGFCFPLVMVVLVLNMIICG